MKVESGILQCPAAFPKKKIHREKNGRKRGSAEREENWKAQRKRQAETMFHVIDSDVPRFYQKIYRLYWQTLRLGG